METGTGSASSDDEEPVVEGGSVGWVVVAAVLVETALSPVKLGRGSLPEHAAASNKRQAHAAKQRGRRGSINMIGTRR